MTDTTGEVFRRGQAFGERMISQYHAHSISSNRRAFLSGVYFAVFTDLRKKGRPLDATHNETPVTKLMMDKHRQLVEVLTENSELRERIGKMEMEKRNDRHS